MATKELFECLCGESFAVEGDDNILPPHKDQSGEVCFGSNRSVGDIRQRQLREEEDACPLGLPTSRCADCGYPCIDGDD